jgi:hypothetical protein
MSRGATSAVTRTRQEGCGGEVDRAEDFYVSDSARTSLCLRGSGGRGAGSCDERGAPITPIRMMAFLVTNSAVEYP